MIEIKIEFHYENPVRSSQWKNSSKARNLIRKIRWYERKCANARRLCFFPSHSVFRLLEFMYTYNIENGKCRQLGICDDDGDDSSARVNHNRFQ